MKIKSEKACYSDELQRIAGNFNADYFVWGEELIDKKLIIYPKKLKGIKIANENDSSPIKQPEEILVFDNLQRTGSIPVIVDDTIRYEEKKLTQEERYITEGFHNQKIENKSFSQILTYIENYSFEKHLKSERQAAEQAEEENVVPIEPNMNMVEEKTIQAEKKFQMYYKVYGINLGIYSEYEIFVEMSQDWMK